MGIFPVVQEDSLPSLRSRRARGRGAASKSNSLVRITNWYWPTMATVGISISRELERQARAGVIVS